LCSSGIAEPRAALRKLLTDPMPSVRLRASLALAQAMDAKAVSTLIALLADLSGEQGKEGESFLTDLAGELAPKVTPGTDQGTRPGARRDGPRIRGRVVAAHRGPRAARGGQEPHPHRGRPPEGREPHREARGRRLRDPPAGREGPAGDGRQDHAAAQAGLAPP